MGRNKLIKKVIAFAVIGIFIGISIISSTGIIILGKSSLPILHDNPFDVSPKPVYTRIQDAVDSPRGLLFRDKTAFAWKLSPNGACYFDLDDPGNIIQLSETLIPGFASGGTWTNDGRWLCCWYHGGDLCEIYPETGELTFIGGGGTDLNGLAYNPVNNKLYGASSNGSYGGLWLIDPDTGEQTYIGDFVNTKWMISIAFDANGVLYGWDIGNDSLWTIDTKTGKASLVGLLGIDIKYAQDGAFDYDTDTLYLSAFTESPNYGGYLYKCDEDTGNCILVGQFEGNSELDALAIPYNWSGPTADFTWTPALPNPSEMILFNASMSYDLDGTIVGYEWDWDNNGIFDENHTNPSATHLWSLNGSYPITLKVTDNASLIGMKTKTVRVGNQPPNPPIITGPTHGKVGIKYEYNFSLSDPNNDSMHLRVDWGNGTPGPWQGSYDSDTTVRLNHTWNKKGTFTIRAQAKDIYDAESDWGELTVRMPKDKTINFNSVLLKLSEKFPLLERLLSKDL